MHWCLTGARVSSAFVAVFQQNLKKGVFVTSSTDAESFKWPPVVFGAATHLEGTCQSIAKPKNSHLEKQQGPS